MPSKREGRVPSYLPFLLILLVALAGLAAPAQAAASWIQRNKILSQSAMQAQSQYTLQGVLAYLSRDSADHAISIARYFLIAGETRTELLFDAPPWHRYLGRQVVVEGTAVSMEGETVLTLRVSRISLPMGEQAALPQAAPVTGTRRVILLLVKFSGDSQEPHPANWYTDIFNPSSGNTVNSFYLANSWGQFGWSADVTNWMTGMDSKTTYANCGWGIVCLDYNHLFNDAVARGVANGVNFALYDNIAIVTNNDLDCCVWGTSAWYYNGKYYGVVWQPPWSAQVGTFAHELGHSIGLPHSGWVYYSYDSPWDVMSAGDQIYNNVNCGSYYSANSVGWLNIYCPTPADIIAPYKDLMGWIDASHLLTVTAGSPASAQVDTLAAPLSGSKKMIKVCVAGKDCTSGGATAQYYTVEARTHYGSTPGFDYYLQNEGVIIHYYWGDWTGPTHSSCYFNYQFGPAYPIDNFNVVPAPHYVGSPTCSEYIGGQKRGLYYANWNDGQTYSTTGITIAIASHSTVVGVTTYVVNVNGRAALNVALVAPANGATVTASPVTFQVRVTDFAGAPVEGAGVTVYVNHPYLVITYFCTSSAKSDSDGYFSCDITLTDSGTNYRWFATASKSGYGSTTSLTGTFDYFAQVTMTVSYSVPGAGAGYSGPTFNYVHGGQSNTYTLTATSTDISVDSGSAWSVTPNPLAGSTPSERWYSSQTLSGTASATVIVFTFYHQYLQTLSYAVSGGGSGYSAPTFTANRYGVSASEALTSTATGYWYDTGSSWSMTNPLSGSGASERWTTSLATSGTVTSAQTVVFTYQHQYYLTTQVSPPGEGTASVVSGWQNSGTTVPVSETPNTGYSFYYWSLDGTNIGSSPSYSVSMNSAHILTAFFRGSSSMSLGLSSGTVDLGSSVTLSGTITPTQPAGTIVALGYSLDGGTTWNTFITTRIDGSGSYSITWCPPYPSTYQIKASWGGNANYADASSSTAPLTVTGAVPAQVMLLVTGQPSIARGTSTAFDVLVTNPGSSLTTTLYIEVIGPGGYEYFDTLQASVSAGSTGRYQFTWLTPSTSGTYQVVVGLIPPRPTSTSQTQITVT